VYDSSSDRPTTVVGRLLRAARCAATSTTMLVAFALDAAPKAVAGASLTVLPYAMTVVAFTAPAHGASAQPAERAARKRPIDPVGVWHCLMFGRQGDQRFYLALEPKGGARIARVTEALEGRWTSLGAWRRVHGRFELEDRSSARRFVADLRAATLGGRWMATIHEGGWWCAPVEGAGPRDEKPPPARGLMQALVPAIIAGPYYPRQALREAREGRAVSCFIVDGRGEISRPGFIELTDEIFREATLGAVARSRFRSRGDDDAPMPACRSFKYELRAAG